MNETEFNGSDATSPTQGGDAQNVTMPLGARDFDEEGTLDPLAGARNGRKLGGSGLLIFAVVVIAVAGLFCMRTLTKATAWDSFDLETEKIIEDWLKEVQGIEGASGDDAPGLAGAMKDDRVLAVLSEPYTERQVALEDVHKNPFIIDQLTGAEPVEIEDPGAGQSAQAARWQQMRRERRAQIEQTGEGLQLKSVIDGAVPLAIIEGRIVHVGDTFTTGPMKVTFRVDAISANAVKLVGEAPELDLHVPVTLVLD